MLEGWQARAEKAILASVGAALIARDELLDLLDDATSPEQIARFEKRGRKARKRFKRDVRKAWERFEDGVAGGGPDRAA